MRVALYTAFLGIEISCGGRTRFEARGADAASQAESGASGIEASVNQNTPDGSSSDSSVDAAACSISPSDYDQSCSVDSDCLGVIDTDGGIFGSFGLVVQSGNYCQPLCLCGGGAINRSAAAQYLQQVSMTPLGSGAIMRPACSCPSMSTAACCSGGRCVTSCAKSTGEAGLESEDASSGDATPAPVVVCSASMGPLDSGTDASGAWRWCTAGESCVPFNGGYACCEVQGGAGFCFAPGASDGGE
jgi:hypothetical protein